MGVKEIPQPKSNPHVYLFSWTELRVFSLISLPKLLLASVRIAIGTWRHQTYCTLNNMASVSKQPTHPLETVEMISRLFSRSWSGRLCFVSGQVSHMYMAVEVIATSCYVPN